MGRGLTGVWLASIAGLLGGPVPVRAGVLVSPTRLVLEERERSGEFILVNNGDEVERYRISVVNRRMDDSGRLVEVQQPGPDDRFSTEMIRFAPRQVELEPREPQTVRILVRRPPGLEPGEYRSHILFQRIPEAPPAAHDPEAGGDGTSVQITPIFGLSVPVIVREGTLHARGALSQLELGRDEDGMPVLRFRLHREGGRSLYGNLRAVYEPTEGPALSVGVAHGVAIYTPLTARAATLALGFPDGRIPDRGRLRLEYREPDGANLIAEAGLALPAP